VPLKGLLPESSWLLSQGVGEVGREKKESEIKVLKKEMMKSKLCK
jgi:hypothetical protein